jgi:hypothetical protein
MIMLLLSACYVVVYIGAAERCKNYRQLFGAVRLESLGDCVDQPDGNFEVAFDAILLQL